MLYILVQHKTYDPSVCVYCIREFPLLSCIVFFIYVPSMLRLVVVQYVRRNSDMVFSGKVHISCTVITSSMQGSTTKSCTCVRKGSSSKSVNLTVRRT